MWDSKVSVLVCVDEVLASLLGEDLESAERSHETIPPPPRVPRFAADTVRPGRVPS